ncbi:MAG: HAD family hydrolase [Treponema sp.]|jgi:phosphoglycolate phosphatase|nr:HAD family hydrolase [Treponema sp.]
MRYSCVIFDCDGTLVDKRGDIAAAMNQSLSTGGFPSVPLEDMTPMMGRGVLKLAFLALPEDARTEQNIQTTAERAQRLYFENPLINSKPYPGVTETLVRLRAKKIKTAVLSNKPDEVLNRVIDGLFPPGTFDAVRGGLSEHGRKPDPSFVWELLVDIDRCPRDAIFAGDSETDMETARAAGCYPLGIGWGFRTREELEAAGAARVINRPDELLEILGSR